MFCCFIELLLSAALALSPPLPPSPPPTAFHSGVTLRSWEGSTGSDKMSNVLDEILCLCGLLLVPRFSDMLSLIQLCLVSSFFKPQLYLLSFSVSISINIFFVLPWSLFFTFFPHTARQQNLVSLLFFSKRQFYFECYSFCSFNFFFFNKST